MVEYRVNKTCRSCVWNFNRNLVSLDKKNHQNFKTDQAQNTKKFISLNFTYVLNFKDKSLQPKINDIRRKSFYGPQFSKRN